MKTHPVLTLLAILFAASAALAQADPKTDPGPAAAPEAAGQPASPEAPPTAEETRQALYALGVQIARTLELLDLSERELSTVQEGLMAGYRGTAQVDPEEFLPKLESLAESRQSRVMEKKKAEAEKVLSSVLKQPGAVRTDSGMVFVPGSAGTGESPKADQTVQVHYRGQLLDGTEFDSSHDRGEPITLPVSGVIPCWTEALQRMKVGGKAEIYCPPDLAYGERGVPPVIGPGETIRFNIELLGIEKETETEAPEPPPQG